ncbi:COG3427 Carbon monoxide dehydrogenase subunit G, CoxG [Burkholderiaceae bacterium]
MDMQGNRLLAVSQQQAWDSLNDPEILKMCIPGCEKFELVTENEYAVTVAVKIGPVSAKFNGKVKLADIQAPVSYALQFEAQGGVAGFGQGESKVELTPHEGGCELKYTVHSKVGGKIAQLGQRLIDGVAKSLAEDFFKRFEEALRAKFAGTGTGAEDAVEQASAIQTTAPSAPKTQRLVWIAVAVVAVALLTWYVRR